MQIAVFSVSIFAGVLCCVSLSIWIFFLPLLHYIERRHQERIYKEAYTELSQSLHLALLHAKTFNTIMHDSGLLYPVDGVFSGLEAALFSLSLLPERLPKDDQQSN